MDPATADSPHASRLVVRSAQMVFAALMALGVFAVQLVRHARLGAAAVAPAIGHALVSLCTRLGATFIKIGQVASTRTDLLPPAIIHALSGLQDRVPAFDFAQVRSTLESEFGRGLEEMFIEFDEVPVAAASVAQVHRARLRDCSSEVAVKVRRPDIAQKIDLDRAVMLATARVLERWIPTLRIISLEAAIRNFADAVALQLDLGREADNNRRFRANFADDPDVAFPALHPEFCSHRVLTMEFVRGVHERDLEAANIDVVRITRAGMRAVCRMIFLHGFVHADLHPGNVRFLAPGRVVLFDLGLTGELSDEDRITTSRLLFAIATGDGRSVARLMYDNAPHTATPDYGAYESEIIEVVANVRDKGLANLQVTLEIARLFDILRRHRVQARSHMTIVNLALMTAEGLGRRLAPELSLTNEAIPYLAEALGIAPPTPVDARPGIAE